MPQQEGEGNPEIPGAPETKQSGPRPPGGGPPGPGGPPGGGFLGFSGVRPQVFGGLTGFGAPGLPIVRRKRGLPAGPGVTPGTPGRGDTVPAMLTPGETVASNGAQAMNPGLTEEILRSNQQALGFEDGGVVPPGGGMGRPSRALRLLQLLLELDEQDGAGVEGFAAGGVAGSGPFGRMNLSMLGNRRPGPGGASPFGGPVGAPQAPGGFQYNRDAEGNATNFNPNDPYGGYGANQNAFGLGQLYRGVGAAGAAGAYDPRGNQQLLNSQLEASRGDADALVRRNMAQADLGGLDPAQRAIAKLQALRETGRGVQEIGANVRADAAGRAQNRNEELERSLIGGGLNYNLSEQNARNQRIAEQNARTDQNKNWWQGAAGQVVGAATNRFLPTGGRP